MVKLRAVNILGMEGGMRVLFLVSFLNISFPGRLFLFFGVNAIELRGFSSAGKVLHGKLNLSDGVHMVRRVVAQVRVDLVFPLLVLFDDGVDAHVVSGH